ncbi:MAG: hypothetical protein QOD61_1417 [Solirubrobacteraceae bacterium]|jgi:hypothetical protein|nr:hypothetical protein [Solirubrobacteraceae bacterium]
MTEGTRAGVRLDTRSLRRLRASGSLTRWVLYVAAAVGVAATARFAIAPPRPPIPRPVPVAVADRAAEGFATLFARRYLTWDAASPALHEQGLTEFLGGSVDADAGLAAPARGSQRIAWAEIVQARTAGPGEHVYTVAAGTAAGEPTYLSVDVVRGGSGELRLGRYPALVGPPLVGHAETLDSGAAGPVSDPGVTTVVDRALRNYLAGSGQNLAADLAPDSVVATPAERLVLDRVEQLEVARGGGVLATVGAHDSLGTTYTLTYQVDLLRTDGRWMVGAIQTDPRT